MTNDGSVDVKKIMIEIKKDIQRKGYSQDMLSFQDVVPVMEGTKEAGFDEERFLEDLYYVKKNWEIKPLANKKLNSLWSVFLFKIKRKIVNRVFGNYINGQNQLNASVMRLMEQMSEQIETQDQRIQELEKKIKNLETNSAEER